MTADPGVEEEVTTSSLEEAGIEVLLGSIEEEFALEEELAAEEVFVGEEQAINANRGSKSRMCFFMARL